MDPTDFQKWLAQADLLTPNQRQRAVDALMLPDPSRASHDVIEERIADERRCPRCDMPGASLHGMANGLQRYRCNHCRRTFNALTGTHLAGLRKKEKWLEYSEALKDGATIEKSAERCGVATTTAFRWRHRFLKNFMNDKATKLSGIAEADETYFLESFKGRRDLTRLARKRGGKATKPGLSSEQVPVLIARDRNGETFDTVLEKADAEHLGMALVPILGKDTLLCTDGSKTMKSMAKKSGIAHQALNIKAGVRVKERIFHVQNVNAYDSRLKGWMHKFNGVATRYLGSYLGWRRFLERHKEESNNPKSWLIAAVGPVQR
ncbi:MAG: IS1595 family transposase [Magnetococcales bacterium]|nr:IS1595 family transposase [Magnetococcales bacterium]